MTEDFVYELFKKIGGRNEMYLFFDFVSVLLALICIVCMRACLYIDACIHIHVYMCVCIYLYIYIYIIW